MNDRFVESIVRTASPPASLSESEMNTVKALLEEPNMSSATLSLPRGGLRSNWLALAAAAGVLAVLMLAMNYNRGGPAATVGGTAQEGGKPSKPRKENPNAVVDRHGRTGPGINFAGSYPKLKGAQRAELKQYELPLKDELIANRDNAMIARVLGGEGSGELLRANGFAVQAEPFGNEFGDAYARIARGGAPVVITPDAVLHLFHICFDETLKDFEEQVLAWDMLDVTRRLLQLSEAGYAQAKRNLETPGNPAAEADRQRALMEAWRLNTAYLAVPCKLLGEMPRIRRVEGGGRTASVLREEGAEIVEVPAFVKDLVVAELALIEKHEGFRPSPVFGYVDDYSQYVPRGHYTRSELLKRYFKSMIWFGRLTFLCHAIPGAGSRPPLPAGERAITAEKEVTQEMAERMTLAAALLAHEVEGAALGETAARPGFAVALPRGVTVRQLWQRVYGASAFYVGAADDLTPSEYRGALAGRNPAELADRKVLREFMHGLEALPIPRIYGGTANLTVFATGSEEFRKVLRLTQGMRLMGQRYIPDSEAMGRLVFPSVGDPLEGDRGAKEGNLTWVASPGGPLRGFPRGLDAAALLGSRRAREILAETKDDGYERYDESQRALQAEWDALTFADWQQNLYYAWLYTLKPLLQGRESRAGHPTFMQTRAYEDRLLTAALASWAQLRHDTILYAKQSVTAVRGGAPRVPRIVGFVEPALGFYESMFGLCEMMRLGMNGLGLQSPNAESRLVRLADMVQRLARISREELAGKELAQEDYEFIRDFSTSIAFTLRPEAGQLDPRALRTDIVADVHTDGNTKQCLQVATGKLRLMAVAFYNPEGELLAGLGPVMTFYEFRHPMNDRLTDEAWQQMLGTETAPADPEWVRNFTGK